jgi:hypothetical protein
MEVSLFAVLIAFCSVALFTFWASYFCSRYLAMMLFGVCIRFVFILIHEQTRIFTDADINDFLPYYLDFKLAIQSGNVIGFIEPHAAFYSALYAGWIFSVVGENGFWVERLINSLLAVSVVAPLSRIHYAIFGKSISPLQVLLIVVWPSWIVYSVYIGRTVLSVLCVLISLSILLEIFNTRKATQISRMLPGFIFSVFLVCMLRVHEIAYFIPILSLGLLGRIARLKNATYLKPVLYLVSFSIAVVTSVGLISLYQKMIAGRYNLEGDSLENAVAMAKGGEFGGSTYLEGVYPNSILDWVWYLPLQGFHFLFSPMPWNIHVPFAAVSSLQAWIILGLCVYGFYRARKFMWSNSLLKLLLITVLFTSLAFGSGVKNAGSAERWRMPLTLILLTVSTYLRTYSVNKTRQNFKFLVDGEF